MIKKSDIKIGDWILFENGEELMYDPSTMFSHGIMYQSTSLQNYTEELEPKYKHCPRIKSISRAIFENDVDNKQGQKTIH